MASRPTGNLYGYIPVSGETLSQSLDHSTPPDLKEAFDIGPLSGPAHPITDPDEWLAYSPNLWPKALPELRAAWTDYYAAMFDLCANLMSLFARGLNLPADFFADKIDCSPDILRAINDPVPDTAPEPGQLRAGAHTDYGTLTVLRQDSIGGLEVVDLHEHWVAVDSVPGAFVINIGDLMARWTNDRWKSTLHRVVDPTDRHQTRAGRRSMPYFQSANWSAEISCLPSCLSPGEAPKYQPVLAGPHAMSKFRKSITV